SPHGFAPAMGFCPCEAAHGPDYGSSTRKSRSRNACRTTIGARVVDERAPFERLSWWGSRRSLTSLLGDEVSCARRRSRLKWYRSLYRRFDVSVKSRQGAVHRSL